MKPLSAETERAVLIALARAAEGAMEHPAGANAGRLPSDRLTVAGIILVALARGNSDTARAAAGALYLADDRRFSDAERASVLRASDALKRIVEMGGAAALDLAVATIGADSGPRLGWVYVHVPTNSKRVVTYVRSDGVAYLTEASPAEGAWLVAPEHLAAEFKRVAP